MQNPLGTMELLKRLGVQVLRTSITWRNVVAPETVDFPTKPAFDATDPSAYPQPLWATFDAVDRAAAATGIRLYITLVGPAPLWAAGPGAPTKPSLAWRWRPSPADFGQFAQAAGTRYDGRYRPPGASSPLPRVSFWSIWNEPNYGTTLLPQATPDGTPISPGLYRGLIDAAWEGLHASGHSPATDTILIGETAPYGYDQPGEFGEMVPLKFIRALYCVGSDYQPLQGAAATEIGCPASATNFRSQNPGLFGASGWAAHPYTGGKPPTTLTSGFPLSADYADFPALPRLEGALDKVTAAYGSAARFPIYNTEFGFQTNPPNTGPSTVSPPLAARYMNEAEYLSWSWPRIRSFDQYELTDPSSGSKNNFDTGLEYASGAPKSSFDAYRMPLWLPLTTQRRNARLEVWGCARGAPVVQRHTGHPQEVQIQLAAHGRYQTLASVTLDPARDGCYFATHVHFPGSGSVRLAWRDGSTTQYSRLQPITADA